MLTRRRLLGSAAVTALAAPLFGPGGELLAADPLGSPPELGAPRPFSYALLTERAREIASQPYRPRETPAPEVVKRLDYEAVGKVGYKPEDALYAEGPGIYPATFFHLGEFFPKPVRIHAVEGDSARAILYAPGHFAMPEDSPAREMPEGAGFAGFRLQESRAQDGWERQDWVAFLGASYFRAIGELGQYGISARGIALDVATAGGEEFPDFTEFYIAPSEEAGAPVEVHAFLDGPSIAGAYRFALQRSEGVVTEVEARLFLRAPVERFGIAPLSSMMWFSEHNRPYRADWRPEVHDSDGLELWTGAGERIWRPLNNPPRVMASSFADESPRGFGLMQRDRDFENYLDGVRYERRPSVWIEPLDGWGRGAVQLIEIPTDDEIHDNVTAFWVPEKPTAAGESYNFHYRLHWLADMPYPAESFARCVATRIGRGGEPGKPRPEGVQKFVVEFAGPALAALAKDAEPEARVTASRGEISYVFVEKIPGTERWRAQFDVTAEGEEPVELRLYLALARQPLSETWLFQHFPQATDS
ncbi:MAG: glucan biosynthesis protein D [Rhodovibrionaceae bacterium]